MLEDAKLLLAEAKKRRLLIGDDHGDPYENALLTGQISAQVKIWVKELFEHLRSSLDYCARTIVEQCCVPSSDICVYFPITGKTFREADFRSRVGKSMPELLSKRPDLVVILASFQPFSDSQNDWLADLATLSNRSKHVELSIAHFKHGQGLVNTNENGVNILWTKKPDGSPLIMEWMMLVPKSANSSGDFLVPYISLDSINKELLTFSKQCIDGVEGIINCLEKAI